MSQNDQEAVWEPNSTYHLGIKFFLKRELLHANSLLVKFRCDYATV